MIMVHMRLKRTKLKEIELIAVTGLNENNKDAITSLLEGYYELTVPGSKENNKEEAYEDTAKKVLASEAKKVFAVRPAGNDILAAQKMAKNPQAAQLSRHFLKNKKIYDHKKMIRK